jgi:ATP-binding cassette, subfamily C, bacterial exporter for protease/lipase
MRNDTAQRSELRTIFSEYSPIILRAMLLAIVAGLLMLTPMIYMMELYGRAVSSQSLQTLITMTLAVLAAYALMEVLHWLVGKIMWNVGREIDDRLQARVFKAMFEFRLKRQEAGTLAPINDLRTIREFISSPVAASFFEIPVAIIVLGIVSFLNHIVLIFSLIGAVIQLILLYLTEKNVRPPLLDAGLTSVKAQKMMADALKNVEVIEAMGMRPQFYRKWYDKQKLFLIKQALASERAMNFGGLTKTLMLAQGSLLMGLSFWLMLDGFIASGALAIFAGMLGAKILQPLVGIVSGWQLVVGAKDSFLNMEKFLAAMPEVTEKMPLPAPEGSLQLEGVAVLAPNGNSVVLRNVSFSLPAGASLAVIGPSGSGKTSLARAIMGVWPLASGKIRIDGAELDHWEREELGRFVGYLPQDVELFEGSFAENIARFRDLDEASLAQVVQWTGLETVVSQLPEGLDSPVGIDGNYLSGGQRQRVGLARALYGAPKLVVLDEPNASLDIGGIAMLNAVLDQLKAQSVTTIIISHRPDVLQRVDFILFIKDGLPQLFGPRDQVLERLQPAGAPQQAAA